MQDVDDADLMTEVFSKVPSAIIVLDEKGVIKTVNEAAIALLGEEDLEERRWVEIVSEAFRPRHDDGYEISTKDGRRLQVLTLPLRHGQLIQMTDLTETRALQDKMAHMERLSSLGRMAASLAHQIRTPLSAAMLYAANLANANLQPMARKRFQEKLMSRLEALEAQVSDILMFARSNEQTVSEIDAGSLIDATVNNVSALMTRNNIELESISDAGDMPILGNSTALAGALSNLITNAAEAGASKIIFKLSKDEDRHSITFTIANNGPHIPEESRSKIFEPFFTSKSSGTGLGLAVVSAVTKVHQGTIELHTDDSEYGTVFELTIPLYTGSTGAANAIVKSALRGQEEKKAAEAKNEAALLPQAEESASSSHQVLRSSASVDDEQALAPTSYYQSNFGTSLSMNQQYSSVLQQEEEERVEPFIAHEHDTASGTESQRFTPMNWNEVEIDVNRHGAFVSQPPVADDRERTLRKMPLGTAKSEQMTNAKENPSVGEANAVLFAAMRSQHISRR